MRLLGTIYEWIEHNADAFITNRKFLQEGVSLYNYKKLKEPVKYTYSIGYCPGNYADTDNMSITPLIYFGKSAGYIVSGWFEYDTGATYWATGQAGSFPLSKEMLEDPNWEEYDSRHYNGEI